MVCVKMCVSVGKPREAGAGGAAGEGGRRREWVGKGVERAGSVDDGDDFTGIV